MPKVKISEYSATANSNTDVASVNIDEGCAPSGINNAIRAVMGHLKDFQAGTNSDSFNGPVGTTTPAAGAFTTLSATGQVTSTVSTGTAPLVIASTTKVTNLNVDQLDGADWAAPPAIGSGTPAAGSFTTLSATGNVTLGDAAADTVTVNGTTNFVVAPTVGGVGQNGFKNRIINGAMVIDQRNAGASVTPTASAYTLDRWKAWLNVASKFSVQQTTSAPAGFMNSLGVTSASAYTIGAGEFTAIGQSIEGLNVFDFGWGAAGAQSISVSFWVRSSLTGTFGGSVTNSAGNRSYPFTYAISAANTWEQKSVIIAGDTSGTWLTTNGTGLQLFFGLGCGSSWSGTAGAWNSNYNLSATGAVSVVGTSGATLNITGVQLEKGSTATSFDYRPYGTELALCQRYFYAPSNRTSGGVLKINATTNGVLPVEMRATPTMTVYGVGGWTGANSGQYDQDAVGNTSATISAGSTTREFRVTPSSGSLGGCSYKAETEL